MRLKGKLLVLASLLAALCGSSNAAASPPVNIRLSTAWPAPPLLLEILETISLEKPRAFFQLLDVLTSPEQGLQYLATTDEALHEAAFKIAEDNGFFDATGSLDAARRALALHVASPKVEAFHHYYRDHEWPHPPEGHTEESCSSWVDWYGQRICDVEELSHVVGVETIEPSNSTGPTNMKRDPVDLLPFDHVHPPLGSVVFPPTTTAILYGNLSSQNFRSLHSYLYSTASDSPPKVQYVIRFTPSAEPRAASLPLTGYGVALDLKKTEYLAHDDRRTRLQESPEAAVENGDAEDTVDAIESMLSELPLFEGKDLVSPLESDEIPQLGYQATQLIMNSTNPLETLKHLTQNFPKYMLSLARRVNISNEVEEEAATNGAMFQGGMNLIWLNGGIMPEVDVHPFGLLRALRKERDMMTSLTSLGLNASEAIGVLTHPSIIEAQAQGQGSVTENMFDSSDRIEGGNVVVYWNNLEADSRYSKWSSSMSTLLQAMFPGQTPPVARNLWNVILVVDLSTTNGMGISVQISRVIQNSLPVRFGVVPMVHSIEAARAARLFYYLIDNFGRSRTMGYIKQLLRPTSPNIDFELAKTLYDDFVANNLPDSETPLLDFEDVIREKKDSEDDGPSRITRASQYMERLGLTTEGEGIGHTFVNGKYYPLDNRMFTSMQYEIQGQLQILQEQVMLGAINDTEPLDMENYFYDLPTTLKRRNMHIYPSNGDKRLRVVPLPELYAETSLSNELQDWIYPDGDQDTPASVVVLGDMNSEDALGLFEQMIGGTSESRYRGSFVHIPPAVPGHTYTSALLQNMKTERVMSNMTAVDLLATVNAFRQMRLKGNQDEIQYLMAQNPNLGIPNDKENRDPTSYEKAIEVGMMLKRKLNLVSDKPYLMVNGRIIGPLPPNSFMAADFPALVDFEIKKRIDPAIQALQNSTLMEDASRVTKADIIATASSIVAAAHMVDPAEQGIFQRQPAPRNRFYHRLAANHTSFKLGNEETAIFHVGILLDPLSEAARKWVSLIEWLAGIDGLYVQIHLMPLANAQIPLKGFYRFNLLDRMKFDEAGSEAISLTTFNDLPIEPIYTLAMDAPTPWLVRPNVSIHDLDNIQLATLSPSEWTTGVEASFRLDYLVIEGHSRDATDNTPTAGLQLELVDARGVPVADTMVVANLGYMQLKAPHPGVFELRIREGRGREVYYMESAGNQGFHSRNVSEVGSQISLTSLEGLTLYPRLVRNPGMEEESVLVPAKPAVVEKSNPITQIYDKVTSFMWGSQNEEPSIETVTSPRQADINVFTVASGHLYERLSTIMILSVLRNTKKTVKFWFIENFLSPTFLEFIPHYAKEYGFEYELVTYKWPSWLRAQKEKQRIIWAYKILFLDVLFPMDLKKVIFVDADQIMRADLQELVDLDLKGAPYGYTPMGDDNYDMEGFRFWKTGYWKEFLRGLPYHISALYVVDLERFRQIAAGDRLRGHYQTLSADPHSLSNLDQDLPNNMQHEIPIYSLHEDWLWCETWCNMDRFEQAKSIDLCFNPLTKESKLVRARKTPGWIEYDNEIAQFTKRLVEEGKLRSDAALDTEALAQIGNTAGAKEEKEPVEQKEERAAIVGDEHASTSLGESRPTSATHNEL